MCIENIVYSFHLKNNLVVFFTRFTHFISLQIIILIFFISFTILVFHTIFPLCVVNTPCKIIYKRIQRIIHKSCTINKSQEIIFVKKFNIRFFFFKSFFAKKKKAIWCFHQNIKSLFELFCCSWQYQVIYISGRVVSSYRNISMLFIFQITYQKSRTSIFLCNYKDL